MGNQNTGLAKRKPLRAQFKNLSIDNDARMFANARAGLSPQIFYQFARHINVPDKFLANLLHLSPRTISNYVEKHKPLDPIQSEHLLKLIALYDKGEDILEILMNSITGLINNFGTVLKSPLTG